MSAIEGSKIGAHYKGFNYPKTYIPDNIDKLTDKVHSPRNLMNQDMYSEVNK